MTKFRIKLDRKRKEKLEFISSEKNFHHNLKKKTKAKVVLLRSNGKSIKEIMNETNLSKGTIIKYLEAYCKRDMNGIIGNVVYKVSELENIKSDLINEFKESPPYSYKEASERIKNYIILQKVKVQLEDILLKIIFTHQEREKLQKRKTIEANLSFYHIQAFYNI